MSVGIDWISTPKGAKKEKKMSQRGDDKDDPTQPPPNNTGVNTAPQEHELLRALKDMKKVAAQNRCLRGLARAQHGRDNRVKWIETRQKQIDYLDDLTKDLLVAYDDGDQHGMVRALKEIDRVVATTEGDSELERDIDAVVLEAEADEAAFQEVQTKVFGKGAPYRRRPKNDGGYN